MKSLSTSSCCITGAAVAQGKGEETSRAPEIENLGLNVDAGSETMCKFLNILNFNFFLSNLLELL